MSYVLGLDLGTSSLKGILVNKRGEIVQSESESYQLNKLKSGYSEQNPELWIEAARQVLKKMIKNLPDILENLEGISFSGQMHSLVLIDNDGMVLRDAILWNDVRTTIECQNIMEAMPNKIIDITKNVALEGFTLPKILWVKENEPDVWNKVSKFMLPKDYLAYKLTGNIQMDYSDAAGTLLLDVSDKSWSSEIINAFELSEDMMPDLINSSDFRGYLLPELRKEFGFKKDIKIFGGGADNACAAFGAGITSENIGMVSVGTSGVFLSCENEVTDRYKGNLHLFNHVLDDTYYSMGVTLAAGDSLSWFKNTFAPTLSFEELLSEIHTVSPGSNNLLFTPYLMGERTPHADSKIRGSFIGIDRHHELQHFTRSVLEGITFALKDSQNLMEKHTNKKFDKIVSVGGGAKNSEWLQMQADIFNVTIVTLETEQGPGLGAAMLAALGCNWFDTVDECVSAFVKYKDEFSPIPQNVIAYKRYYELYQKIYKATSDIIHQLQ